MFPGGTIVRVTPTVIAGTTHDNDVMFDATEIPRATSSRGGVSKLLGYTILNKDLENHDMDLVFMQKQTNIGTAGAAVDVSDANISAAGLITVSKIDYGDQNSNLVNSSVVSTFSNIGSTSDNQVWTFSPCLLQAESGATSIYFTAVAREEMAFAATDDLEFIFHIEYLN